MLRFLSIRHLAVIERLEIEFERGLNVLTGETGAGKSILVGAVGLLVGGRASADLVRTGEESASIEAIFETSDGRDVIVRREITAHGRSRAFVDGALVTTAQLRELTGGLVDLHGQHEHQVLLDPAAHLALLDEFAGLGDLRARVATAFDRWRQARTDRERLEAQQRDAGSRAEFLSFQLAEIERIGPRPDEDAELAATRQVLANAEKLQRLCSEAYAHLYESDGAALATLGGVWRRVAELAAIDDRFAPHAAARDVIKTQLEDLAFMLRSYSAALDASPSRLQELEDRLATLERLKKKHGPTLADVIARVDQLRAELAQIEGHEERLAASAAALDEARHAYSTAARDLSARRRRASDGFCRLLESSLQQLAMPHTRCQVRFEAAESEAAWLDTGVDRGEFYISANAGEDLRPLARIASGGELSRLMLALKTLATTDAPGKTLIFDEVDAGIGGAVADVVGARLQALGARFQVLCITHLPQIAAHAATHFRISKAVRRERTVTDVLRLSGPRREEELARMIAGADISDVVLAGARQMLRTRNGAKVEKKAKGESESPGARPGRRQ